MNDQKKDALETFGWLALLIFFVVFVIFAIPIWGFFYPENCQELGFGLIAYCREAKSPEGFQSTLEARQQKLELSMTQTAEPKITVNGDIVIKRFYFQDTGQYIYVCESFGKIVNCELGDKK